MLRFSTKKKPSWPASLGFLAMMGVAACILFVRTPSVKPDQVDAALVEFSDYLTKNAALVGLDAKVSYASAKLEGIGYERFVVLQGVHLVMSPKGSDNAGWSLDTSKITVAHDPLNANRMIFKFAEPFTFTLNGQKTTVSFPTPMRFGYFRNIDPKQQINEQATFRFPPKVTLANEDPAKPALALAYDQGPEAEIKRHYAAHEQEENIEIRNITVQSGTEQKATIGAVNHNITEKEDGQGKISGTFVLTVSDYTHQASGAPAKTCSLTSNIVYTSAQSLINPLGLPKTDIDGKINRMLIACDDFSIKITGELAVTAADSTPTAKLNVAIDNLKPFLASDLISDQTRDQLTAALPKIIGRPLDGLEKTSFDVKRDKGGELMLGAVSAHDAGIAAITNAIAP